VKSPPSYISGKAYQASATVSSRQGHLGGLLLWRQAGGTDLLVAPHAILPSDVRTRIAKRAACLVLLMPLVLFEMYLCTTFLPTSWQRAINDSLPNISPKSHDWTSTTHPLLNEEVEQVMREHVGLRITVFVVNLALLLGNAWLIRRVWRFSGRAQTSD